MSGLLRRLAGPLLLVVCVHLAFVAGRAALHEPEPAPAPPSGALMVAAGGPLDELAIQFHRPGHAIFLPVFEQLFAALDPSSHVIVVVADADDEARFEAALEVWRRRRGAVPSVSYARVGRPITSWARDRLAVLGEGDLLTILAPPTPMTGPEARANDWLVPWTLAEHLRARREASVELITANFRFEGGDLIADEDHVYVATPLFGRNPEVSPERLLDSIRETLARPVVRLGMEGRPAPSHHIGMFVTPLGGGLVAYGDPRLGLELVGGATELEVGGAPLRLDGSEDTTRPFDEVGETLRAQGLRTLALPLLVSDEPHNWISYDNVLMERRRDGRLHVYMPTYGLPALDRRAQQVYEGVGAVVHPIAVERLFRLGGTVRCLVAPLRRG